MPSINRIRLANIDYNEKKFRIDDLNLDVGGLNALIDMENGLGKTFILQCLLQTVYPGAYLSKDFRINLLFDGENSNKAVHCLTEWELDEGSEFKYALAGFCGYPVDDFDEINHGTDDEDYVSGSARYESLKYICFYNKPNKNDIRELPIVKELENGNKQILTHRELRDLLYSVKKDEKEDYLVVISRTKDEHYKLLSQYNINKSEIEFMLHLNRNGEAKTHEYFRNFKTSASFIQDCLIPIVESSISLKNSTDYQDENKRAKLLLDLKDTIHRLEEKESLSKEYEIIGEFCQEITSVIETLKKSQHEQADIIRFLSCLSVKVHEEKIDLQNQLNRGVITVGEYDKQLEELQKEIKECEHLIQLIELCRLEAAFEKAEENKNKAEQETVNKKLEIEALKKEITCLECEKLYTEILEIEREIETNKIAERALSLKNEELNENYKLTGNLYGNIVLRNIEKLKTEKHRIDNEIEDTTNLRTKLAIDESENNRDAEQLEDALKRSNQELSELSEEMKGINKRIQFISVEDALKEKATATEQLERLSHDTESMKELKSDIQVNIQKLTSEITAGETQINTIKNIIQREDEYLLEFNQHKETIAPIESLYGDRDILSTLKENIELISKKLHQDTTKASLLEKEINSLENNQGISTTESAIKQYEVISEKYKTATWGSTYLEGKAIDEKTNILTKTPLLMYSIILLESDFERLKKDDLIKNKYVNELIPVVNAAALEKEGASVGENILFTSKSIQFFIDEELRLKQIAKLKKSLISINADILEAKNKKSIWGNHQLQIRDFYTKYPLEDVSKALERKKSSQEELEKEHHLLYQNQEHLIKSKDEKLKLEEAIVQKLDDIQNLSEKVELTENQIQLLQRISSLSKKNSDLIQAIKNNTVTLESRQEALVKIKELLKLNRVKLENLKIERDDKGQKLANTNALLAVEPLSSFPLKRDNTLNINELSEKDACERFKIFADKLSKECAQLKNTQQQIKNLEQNKNKKNNELKERCGEENIYTFDYFKIHFKGESKEYIREISVKNKAVNVLNQTLSILEQNLLSATSEAGAAEGVFNETKNKFIGDFYSEKGKAIELKLQDLQSDKLAKIHKDKILRESKFKQEEKNSNINQSINDKNLYTERISSLITEFRYQSKIVKVSKTEALELKDYKISDIRKKCETNTRILEGNYSKYNTTVNKIQDKLGNPHLAHFKDDLKALSDECPKSIEDSVHLLNLINGEQGYLALLENEKNSIVREIAKLKEAEDHFVKLCVQHCEGVYRDLMSIEQLSQITLYGRKIKILTLKMNPMGEEYRYPRMKEYIRNVLVDISGLEDKEKQNVLKAKLSSKSLFSQFVKDIDRCEVEIYKVENKKTDSRALKWKKAMGSTGQSNGMYLTLSICLLSYIRQLHNPQAADEKKFLILDSPWSGTVAAYIWEPVIKLIDQNNIQLFSVGYDVPVHLLPLFRLKYYLRGANTANGKTTILENHFEAVSFDRDSLHYKDFEGERLDQLDLYTLVKKK